jgi:hypothetical protein
LKQNYRSEQEMGMFITHFIYWTLQGWALGHSLVVKFKYWGTTVTNLKLYSWWNKGQISFEKHYHAAWLKYKTIQFYCCFIWLWILAYCSEGMAKGRQLHGENLHHFSFSIIIWMIK